MKPGPRRVTIVGNSASGKSTLAEKLGERLVLPVCHLDHILWHANWVPAEEEEFNRIHDRWTAEPAWLIEGVGYWGALHRRFAAADQIVFLDTPRALCLARAERRRADERHGPNRFISAGCSYLLVEEKQRQIIDCFEVDFRPPLLRILDDDFRDKPQLVLDGRLKTDQLITQLMAELAS